MTALDHLAVCRTALAASAQTDEPALSTHYLAAARCAFTHARDDLANLERLLIARERELVHVAHARQLGIKETDK